jgi:hypothetical protein
MIPVGAVGRFDPPGRRPVLEPQTASRRWPNGGQTAACGGYPAASLAFLFDRSAALWLERDILCTHRVIGRKKTPENANLDCARHIERGSWCPRCGLQLRTEVGFDCALSGSLPDSERSG